MRASEDESAAVAARLAVLLADERGAEILAEFQKLERARWTAGRSPGAASGGEGPAIGVWDTERTGDGVALRRREGQALWWRWADVAYVPPPAGSGRVVLAGESVARGWLLEPSFTPALALRRHLPHQVVDLARSNADIETLRPLIRQLPLAEPDVVVLFAGNNFGFAPLDGSYRDLLARALRAGGYAEMRRAYVDSVVLPRVDGLLSDLAGLRGEHGIEVVLVVPETNLRGWVPAAGIEVPVLPGNGLAPWYELRRQALAAQEAGEWARMRDLCRSMSLIDGGLSPVSGYLQGQAAARLGDGEGARELLQGARDATCGLLLDHVTGISTPVRARLLEFARDNGIRCVDASGALRGPDLPELPDPHAYLDHVHLSDDGIERVMSRVADAVLGSAEGTAKPGPGADPRTRAIGRALAAGYAALRSQPEPVVRYQMELAMAADREAATEFAAAYLDVLESSGIHWTHPAMAALNGNPQTLQVGFQVAQSRGHSSGYWTFRGIARELAGRGDGARDCHWQRIDLLRLADGRGYKAPNFTPGKAFYEATAQRSVFPLALDRPAGAALCLAYRLAAGTAKVTVNGRDVGELPASPKWSRIRLQVPAAVLRAGINTIELSWPVPRIAADAQVAADASALSRHMFPQVLPVFGGLFTAFLEMADLTGARQPSPAARTDASALWRA